MGYTCDRCGKPLPDPVPGVPMRRYCKDSHRVMSSRDRLKAGIPRDPVMQARVRIRWDRRVDAPERVQ